MCDDRIKKKPIWVICLCLHARLCSAQKLLAYNYTNIWILIRNEFTRHLFKISWRDVLKDWQCDVIYKHSIQYPILGTGLSRRVVYSFGEWWINPIPPGVFPFATLGSLRVALRHKFMCIASYNMSRNTAILLIESRVTKWPLIGEFRK